MSAAITTIIPTFRRPRLVARAIRSVLRQTFGDFAVCVYDNASDDDTEASVRAASAGDRRVEYFRHAKNIGGAANFRFGMQRVQTPYFSFLSDDDVLLPDFFATALDGFSQERRAMMSAASTIEVTAQGEPRYAPLARWPRDGVYPPPDGAFRMLGNRHPTWTTVLFRREAIDAIGLLDLAVGAPSDLDFELRIALRFPIVVSRRACGAYVSHAGSGSSVETADIASGFEAIARNVESDDAVAPLVRDRMAAALRRQLRAKLFEIWGKAVVRGDDAAADAAALALRDRFGSRFAGAALAAMGRMFAGSRGLRSLARWLEARRLALRAASTTDGYRAAMLPAIRETLAL